MQDGPSASFAVELYGQCANDIGGDRPVVVSELSARYCRLRDRMRELKGGGRIRLWIGAIGPIDSVVSGEEPEGQRIDFLAPLHPAILDHFCAC